MFEKKHLNEDELKKVTGGEEEKEICPHCTKSYVSYEALLSEDNQKLLCPHCKKVVQFIFE